MRLPVNRFAALTLTTMLIATGPVAAAKEKSVAVLAPVTGPAADYPMVLGEPFVVDGVTYTPQDKLNFDQVGYAGVSEGTGVSIAHRTLPLPSYAEVTSLDTGRTILVRVTRRGPMAGPNIVDLSPAAATQLGVSSDRAPIRIRRVNPPEPERAALREGRVAPLRMDTPMSLVAVLRRKLDPGSPAPALLPLPKIMAPAAPQPAQAAGPVNPAPVAVAAKPVTPPLPVAGKSAAPAATVATQKAAQAPPSSASVKSAKPVAVVSAKQTVPASPATPKAISTGSLVVQVGAYSSQAKSQEIASKIGGSVSSAGKVFRVRMGPFSSRGQAEAALAKAKAAGYTDARIQSAS